MFKVTIKQYVKPLCALILIAAVLNSGCISTSSSNTAEDVPVVKAEPEKVIKTTPDGMSYFVKPHQHDGYWAEYDTDGDGDIDACDGAVGPHEVSFYHDDNIKQTIRGIMGIPIDSKLYQDYPDIEELRIRQWDLDGDGKFKEKIDLLINGEIVYTTTTNTNHDGGVGPTDAFLDLGWL